MCCKRWPQGRGGDPVVSVRAFYSNDTSSRAAEVYSELLQSV